MASDNEILITKAALKETAPTHMGSSSNGRVLLTMDSVSVEAGDTGWRDVTGLLANGWEADQILIRRSGQWSSIRSTRISGANATSGYFLSGIAGFFVPNMYVSVRVGSTWADLWCNGPAMSAPMSLSGGSVPAQGSQFVGDVSWPDSAIGEGVSV